MKPPAPAGLASPQGKERKRRELGSPPPEFPEPPAPVDLDTPRKKEKKKKKRIEEREASLAAGDEDSDLRSPPPLSPPLDGQTTSPKIKKNKEMSREEESPLTTKVEVEKKKKKGGREVEGEEEEETVSNPAVTRKEKKKKKKRERQTEEEEQRSADSHMPVAVETSKVRKKKKKKEQKNKPVVVSITTVTTNHNSRQPDLLVPMETTETRMKRRKKKKGESVVEVTVVHNTTDSQEVVTVKEKKNTKRKMKENGRSGGGEEEEQSRRRRREKDGDGGGGEVRVKKRKKSNTVEREVDEVECSAALLELEQFVPNARSRSANEIRNLLRYDLDRFIDFRRQGISLRSGRFAAWENQRIRHNVADFLALSGISSANQLLFPQRFKQQDVEIKKLRVQHRFLGRIAEGIPRSCQQIYIRTKKLFDGLNHMGRFSEDEVHSLVKLQTLHGNSWRTIAQSMDRSVYSLQKRYAQIATSHGSWAVEEVSRLNQALKAHMEALVQGSGSWLSRDQLCNNLPWKEISQQVQTRSWSQCRVKWFTILKSKMVAGRHPGFSRGPVAVQAKIHLINRLYSLNVEDSADIDWDEMVKAFSNLTSHHLQRMFHRLKVSRVPNWSSLPFCEIIDFLQNKVVPHLKNQLEQLRVSGASEGVQQEVQDRYLLSDIFSQDEEYKEVDNTQLIIVPSERRLKTWEEM